MDTSAISGVLTNRNDIELPYRSPFQPYTAWATMIAISVIIFFSGMLQHLQPPCHWLSISSLGFDIFFPGNFTASGFLTNYIDIPIFAGKFFRGDLIQLTCIDCFPGLYIFFRFFFYKSSIIPLQDINLEDEFNKLAEEKAFMPKVDYSRRSWASKLYHKVF